MARKAKHVPEDQPVERIVSLPGWLYNLLVDRAERERRGVKYQIEVDFERLAREHLLPAGQERESI